MEDVGPAVKRADFSRALPISLLPFSFIPRGGCLIFFADILDFADAEKNDSITSRYRVTDCIPGIHEFVNAVVFWAFVVGGKILEIVQIHHQLAEMDYLRDVVGTPQFLFKLLAYAVQIRSDRADQADENLRSLCMGRRIAGMDFIRH
jgi:hypothetical protein